MKYRFQHLRKQTSHQKTVCRRDGILNIHVHQDCIPSRPTSAAPIRRIKYQRELQLGIALAPFLIGPTFDLRDLRLSVIGHENQLSDGRLIRHGGHWSYLECGRDASMRLFLAPLTTFTVKRLDLFHGPPFFCLSSRTV